MRMWFSFAHLCDCIAHLCEWCNCLAEGLIFIQVSVFFCCFFFCHTNDDLGLILTAMSNLLPMFWVSCGACIRRKRKFKRIFVVTWPRWPPYPYAPGRADYICTDLSRDMTKPTKWVCAQRRLRSAWASAQSDQSIRCALNGWLNTQCFFTQTAKTLIRLGGCPG